MFGYIRQTSFNVVAKAIDLVSGQYKFVDKFLMVGYRVVSGTMLNIYYEAFLLHCRCLAGSRIHLGIISLFACECSRTSEYLRSDSSWKKLLRVLSSITFGILLTILISPPISIQ